MELRVLHHFADGPLGAAEVAPRIGLSVERAELLLNAGVAIGILTLRRDRCGVSIRGAALTGMPGLEQMIAHHAILYRDLVDPVAFLRGKTDPELSRFWPYVFGGGGGGAVFASYGRQPGAGGRGNAARGESLGHLAPARRRGRNGCLPLHVAERAPGIDLMLLGLPEVLAGAGARLAECGTNDHVALHPGSFRTDDLPRGANAITFVRVLYDHSDATVRDLLAKVRAALPPPADA